MKQQQILASATIVASLWMANGCARSVTQSHARTSAPVNATIKRQVLNAVDAGEGDARVRAWQKQLLENPDQLEPRLALADHYASLGYPELAVEHLRIAEIRLVANAEVVRRLVANLRRMDLANEAVQTIERYEARVERPDAALSSLRGILLDEQAKYAQAEPAHRKAVELNPTSDVYRNNLGYNLQLQGKRDEAVKEFREALRLQPRSEIARNNLAFALAESGADPTAEVMAHWTSLRGPAAAHNNMGAVLMGQKKYPEARREFEEALRRDPSYAAAWRNLEMVSELDGGKAAIQPRADKGATESGWKRFRQGLRAAFIGESVLKPEQRSDGPKQEARDRVR